jgi:hypothetical protein
MKSSYRKDFPMDSLTEVADVARKLAGGDTSSIDKASALHSAWDVWGYAQGMALPDEGAVMAGAAIMTGAAPALTCFPDDLNRLADKADEVKAALPKRKASKKTVAALNFDWKSLAKMLLPLILALLG